MYSVLFWGLFGETDVRRGAQLWGVVDGRPTFQPECFPYFRDRIVEDIAFAPTVVLFLLSNPLQQQTQYRAPARRHSSAGSAVAAVRKASASAAAPSPSTTAAGGGGGGEELRRSVRVSGRGSRAALRARSIALGERQVWAWGRSQHGLLGLGAGIDHAPHPQRISALDGHSPLFLAASETHAAVVTDRGGLWLWGGNTGGLLGVPLQPYRPNDCVWEPQQVPHRLPARDLPIQVVCGNRYTMLLTEQGRVYSWGRGRHGVRDAPTTVGAVPHRVSHRH